MANFVPAVIEAAKDAFIGAVESEAATQGREMVDEGINYLKRKKDAIENFIVEEIHDVGDLLNNDINSMQLVKNDYYQSKLNFPVIKHTTKGRNKKRRKAEQQMIAASRTVPMVKEAKAYNLIQKGIYKQSLTRMPYTFWLRKRRRFNRRRGRFRKRRKLVTKRGVKAITSRMQGMSPYQEFTHLSKTYFGDTQFVGNPAVEVPNPTYGNIVRGNIGFWWQSDISSNVHGYTKLDEILASKPTLNAATSNNYKYSIKKFSVTLELHSCVNEMFEATFWWCLCKQNDTDAGLWPKALWKDEYVDRNEDTVNAATDFDKDWTTYPTKYKQFNENWKIMKKYKTTFLPGQTKKLKLKGRSFIYKVADNDDNLQYSHAGMTQVLLYQLKGVPTHQNDGVDQTTDVNLTPAALDVLVTRKHMMARSMLTDGIYSTTNSLPAITSGLSLMPEASATITTV